MTDTTQGDTPTPQPPSRLDAVKGFVGDLARPFAIIVTSASAAWATVSIAQRVESFEGAAVYIAAVYAGVAGIYGFKAWEQRGAGRHAAEVEIAKATTPAVAVEDAAKDPPADPAMYGGPRP